MRCLLGLHLSRINTVSLEVAFKVLRKWAVLQRMERARAVLAAVERRLGGGAPPIPGGGGGGAGTGAGAAGGVSRSMGSTTSVSSGQQHGASEDGETGGQKTPRLSHRGEVSVAAAGRSLAGHSGLNSSTFEMFVSLADFPLPAGGAWRPPYDKNDLMNGTVAHVCRLARSDGNTKEQPQNPWAVMGMPDEVKQGKMDELVRQLQVSAKAVAGRVPDGSCGPRVV